MVVVLLCDVDEKYACYGGNEDADDACHHIDSPVHGDGGFDFRFSIANSVRLRSIVRL